jgi:hypothetical protein
MDNRKYNGGHSTKGVAGRKPKIEEIKLIEQLDKAIDKSTVMKKLNDLLLDGNMQALKLYFEYRFGKPKESVDIHTTGESSVSFNDLLKAVRSGTDK